MNNPIESSRTFILSDIIEYAANSVVSKTIIKKSTGNITMFAFDEGEGLSEHTAPFDAVVQILDGKAEITIDKITSVLQAGQCIILPANIPHALKANEKFKMMLTMIKS
jgi:quercetin dioxygenase-like cupin family protein